jgi:hypothetical protein
VDSIRPIGPVERDLEPIVRVTRAQPDAERQSPKREEDQPRQPPPERPDEQREREEGDGGSHIDVRV